MGGGGGVQDRNRGPGGDGATGGGRGATGAGRKGDGLAYR